MRFFGGRYGRLKKVEDPGDEGARIGYSELVGFAVGVMKISRDDLDWMTPAEYQHCNDAWNKHNEEKERRAYELAGFHAWISTENKATTRQNFIRFEWEPLKMGKIINGSKTDSISKA